MTNYELNASLYCEKYGIIDGEIKGNKMTYYANYPKYLSEPRRTYKIVVNLDKMQEESRTLLKKWNRKGECNQYL